MINFMEQLTAEPTAPTTAQARVVLDEARVAAVNASNAAYIMAGGDGGCCGFAWCTVYKVRSNSKMGKLLAEYGFSKSYSGGLQLWNPGESMVQNIDIKLSGAQAMARILTEQLGLEAFAGSRVD